MKSRSVICGTVAVVGALIASGDALGQTNAQTTGNWSNPSTWTAGEPTTTLHAQIDNGHTVTIDSAGETTNLLDIGTASEQTGALDIVGGTLWIEDTDTVTDPNLPSIRVGQVADSTGTLTMTGGDVFINKFDYDPAPGEQYPFANGDLIIGDVGTGTFNMSAGTMTAADEIIIGLADVAVGIVNVSGGTMETQGRSILVAFVGDGTLNASGTGEVSSALDLLVGFIGGSNGTLNVSDTATIRAGNDLLVGIVPGSHGAIEQTGGTIEVNSLFTNQDAGTGSTATVDMTGGTFNARFAYVLGRRSGTTTANHSGGTINVLTNNGDMVVSDGSGNTTIYNISGTATVNLLHNFLVGVFEGSNGTVNQSGGTITAGDNVIVGRDGVGTFNLSGGTVNATNVFLGDFDTSTGTMKISGGDLNVSGTFNVGGALASNAAPDRVEPTGTNGAQGQALDANGVLIVSGSGATIDVGGNFRANPDDKSQFRSDPIVPGGDNSATLVFEIFDASGTSLIDVAGVADLDGAVIDLDLMSGFTPAVNTTFDLLTATEFGATGTGTTENEGFGDGYTLASEDLGSFSLAIVPGGNGEILQATFLAAPPGLAGDHNEDGSVDAADYVLWRKSPGAFGGDPGGYNAWRTNFGDALAGSGGASGVPEPSSIAMLVLAGTAIGLFRTARNRRGASWGC